MNCEEFIFANEAQLTSGARDNWTLLAPYGDFPYARGVQRITRQDAENVAREFGASRKLPQGFLGLPVYIGHPDHPAFKERDQDTRAYGRVKELQVRPEGLFGNIRWGEAGRKLVESEAFASASVNLAMVKREDAWHPVALKSVGLTNDPGMPVVRTLANEEETKDMEKGTASEQFRQEVDRLMQGGRLTYEQAWNRARILNPSLYADMQKLSGPGSQQKPARFSPTLQARGANAPGQEIAPNTREAQATSTRELSTAVSHFTVKTPWIELMQKSIANESVEDLADYWQKARPADDSVTAHNGVRTALKSGNLVQLFVNERINRFGESYDRAFANVRKAVGGEDSLPDGAEVSSDGEKLLPTTWPVPPAVLCEMGLPLNAPREAYLLYKAAELAEQEEMTPEMAAYIMRTLIQSGQLARGSDWTASFDFVQKHFPDLYEAVREFQPS